MSEPRLRYRFDLHYEQAGESLALLMDERMVHVLEGPLFPRLLPLLDGRLTADDIVDRLPDVSPAVVYYTIAQLQQKRLVVEASDLPLGVAAFWSALGKAPDEAVRSAAAAGVEVRAAGADAAPMLTALRAAGIGVGEDLVVWAVDDYMRPEVAAWNREASRPWILVKPVGMELWLGPLFTPGAAPCHACLVHRLAHHRQVQRVVLGGRPDLDVVPTSLAAMPSVVGAACALAAGEVARALGGAGTRLEGRVISLDVRTLQTQEHVLRRWGACPVCGAGRQVAEPVARRVELRSSRIGYSEDGGFRTALPERTLERLSDLVSPITGIVPLLQRRASDAEGLVSACVSGFNQAFPIDDFTRLRKTMRLMTAGKGKTDAQARASALAEAVERYCGAFHGDEPRRRARLAELGESARHPRSLMLFSDRQYAAGTRRSINAVPPPFDESEAIDWTPAWSLTRDEACWLPTAFCYVGYDLEGRLCIADSNGNAAGNTLEEAVLQGLLELCERDAVALWWYNRVRRPALDLESLGEPYVLRLRESYRELGREIWVLDITTDLGVPSYAAVSRRVEGPEEIVLGFGAHLDARLAVLRAMTEINQFASAASETPPSGVDAEVDQWLEATVAREDYLLPEGVVPARRREWSLDLRDNIESLHKVLRDAGLELIVLDQSRADIDLRVVKVVVPGLRHFWERFAPGRLYDVPVKLGWVDSATPEEDMNPLRMFL